MVERNSVEVDLPGQQSCFVTSRPQAAGIGNFGRRSWSLGGSHILGQLDEPQHFPADLFAHTWGKVALHTRHVTVCRFLPGNVVRFHIVAGAAELGPRRIDARQCRQDGADKEERAENRHDP